MNDHLERLLWHWDLLIQYGSVSCLGLGLVVLAIARPTFFQRYVKKATPESLGAIRVLVCVVLLAQTLWENFASSTLLPVEMRHPMGMLQLFYTLPIGFERLVSNETELQVFKYLTVLFLFLGMIGWGTRWFLPLAALCCFLLGGILRQYTHLYHTGLVPLELIMYSENHTSGIITYYKVLAHRASGDFSCIHLEDAIGAMTDGRSLDVIKQCFEPTFVLCKKFLDVSGAAYNRQVIPGDEVTQFEVQKWLWNFRSHPFDPKYGNLANSFIFEVKKDRQLLN